MQGSNFVLVDPVSFMCDLFIDQSGKSVVLGCFATLLLPLVSLLEMQSISLAALVLGMYRLSVAVTVKIAQLSTM